MDCVDQNGHILHRDPDQIRIGTTWCIRCRATVTVKPVPGWKRSDNRGRAYSVSRRECAMRQRRRSMEVFPQSPDDPRAQVKRLKVTNTFTGETSEILVEPRPENVRPKPEMNC